MAGGEPAVASRRGDRAPGFVAGNTFDKYRSRNPIHRAMVGGFLDCVRDLLSLVRPRRVLEVGCGPGDLAARVVAHDSEPSRLPYVGSDVGIGEVITASRRYAHRPFLGASAYGLPFAPRAFDCVLACEVFEHLEDPPAALAEVARVSSGWLVLSVPWEPVWRLLNVARGRYLGAFGNTPGHVQHFSRDAIRTLVSTRFELVAERHPFPWTVLLGRLPASAVELAGDRPRAAAGEAKSLAAERP